MRIAKLVRSQDDGPFARSHAVECDRMPQSGGHRRSPTTNPTPLLERLGAKHRTAAEFAELLAAAGRRRAPEDRPAEERPREVCLAEDCPDEAHLPEVRTGVGIPETPLVPNGHSLLE
jgi:hypothetical protein